MISSALLFAIFLSQNSVSSFELNSIFGRRNCYNNEQLNCSTDFIDAYPHLSKSATGLTDADTQFLLFTRKNRDRPEKLHKCAGELPPGTNYNSSEELILLANPFVVGFCDVAVYREWIYQILERGNYNVLAVDYSWGNQVDYGTAIQNIKIVAEQTAEVLKNIEKKMGNITVSVVGHSLGAQLAGLIGQLFKLKKITALDPAGPGFRAEFVPENERLDMKDAEFVEVWLCNSGTCLPRLGTSDNVGHVNFYINGGKVQKGCYDYASVSLMKKDFIYGFGTVLIPDICYHAHCAQYYKVAINPGKCKFVAVRCNNFDDFKSGKCKCGANGHSCIVMGFDTEKYAQSNITHPQTFYLSTTENCPYCDKNPFYLGNFSDPYA